jgi:flagellum-specific peptidoglycan hydrolase FlgJ
MLNYLDSKTIKKEDTKEENSTETTQQSDGFVGWKHPESNSSTVSTASSSRWNSPYDGKRDQWITDMTAAYKRQGLNDNAIKNLIAKNALESGWGRSAQGDYNYGNLTTGSSWTGRYVQGNDHDADGNQISQKFRAYDSIDDYVKDEI